MIRSLTSRFILLMAALAIAAPLAAGDAIPRTRVGELAPASLATSHPYPRGVVRTHEIHHPGATYIKVHFSRFELAPGDVLEVASPDGAERYFFKGRGYKQKGGNFWVNSVLGDKVILRLHSVSGGGYGFETDYYAFGEVPLFPSQPAHPESVCGVNDWRDVVCYETSYPTEFDRAKRAVVVLYNGVENCTGVKVGCPNQILTNEHCVTSQGEVDVTEVRFEYQNIDCDGTTSNVSESYLGDLFIVDDYTLDYSLITVEGESDNYLAAEIDPRLPPVGERLYITGHPAGNPKKLSLEDSSSPTGLCQTDVSPTDGRGTDTDVGYYCDTTGGSSGSPVWSGESHKLIALHHFGGCPNSGVRMDLIHPLIVDLLTSCCDQFPNTPTLGAVTNGDNRIDLTWDDSDLATVIEYRVLRSRTPGGPYDTIATVADDSPGAAGGPGYTFIDADVSGGITYYYVVRSSDGSTCTSEASPEVQVMATGSCTLPPVFLGVESINGPSLELCTLELAWSAGTPECGGSVGYNVYRSTTPGFTPGAGNQIASGVNNTTFADIDQLVDGTTYYYVVRAVDTGNGSEDHNLIEVSDTPVGQPASGMWADDAGDTQAGQISLGSSWWIDPTEGNLGPRVYKAGDYANNVCNAMVTPTLQLGLGSQLTFWARYDIEDGADKGEVQLSTDGGTTWQRVPVDYPASATGTSDACGLPAGTYFTGTNAEWSIYTADLFAWANQNVLIRWVLSTDSATSGAGWWIDDITVTNVTSGSTCTTGSACADNPFVNVAPDGPLTVCQGNGPTLFAETSGGTGPFSYQWVRDGVPVTGATGVNYRPDDLGVHNYNVRVRGGACPDDVFDGLDTQLYRVNQPFFGGITSAVNPQEATCTVNVNWDPAATACDGPVRYTVYRDTSSPVSVTPENLLAAGVGGTGYADTFALANLQTYHYLVRAQDVSTGRFDTNVIEASATPDGPNNGLNSFLFEDFEDPAGFAQWTVTTGPGPHSCGEWSLSSNSAQRPSGGAGSFMVADSECAPLAPRTSASVDSPPVDLTTGNILSVTLETDLRYEHHNGDDASMEVWDGSQWVVLWSDTNTNVNEKFSFDVGPHALGNPEFRVRFDYQNANADRFYAVDNVDVIADIYSECSTAAAGPPAVPAGSLRAAASGTPGAIDVSWDATTCPAAGYNLIYGNLADVGAYLLAGGECAIGSTGSVNWSGAPAGNIFFLVVGTDGAGTEGSWGFDGGQGERNGAVPSNQCGVTVKDPANLCR